MGRRTFGGRSRITAALVFFSAAIATGAAAKLAGAPFIRGDSNQDSRVDISDARFTLDFLFVAARPLECPAAADANDDELIDISDPIRTLGFLFLGDPPPPPPFPGAGADPTPGLGCGLEPPSGLVCRAAGPAVDLVWAAGDAYDEVEVERDGEVVATLTGSATAYRDRPPQGGTHSYRVHGVSGGQSTSDVTCTVTGLRDNRAPNVVVTSPAQGFVADAGALTVRGRVDDDGTVARLLANGADITPPGPPAAAYSFTTTVPLEPGPALMRFEAIDDFGRATVQTLAVGGRPLLLDGTASQGLAMHISGDTGYSELEVIVRPFLNQVPALLDQAVRGVRIFEGSVIGVDISVTGDRVEVNGAVGFDLFPSALNGGRVGLRVTIPQIRLFGDGESDFGFLGTDSWDAIFTANDVAITGTFAFSPLPGGTGLSPTSDGFVVTIGSSSFSVSGFLDPFGIFDALVNAIVGLFQDQIEDSVRTAVEDAANNQILPLLAETFSALNFDLDLGNVSLDSSFHDVLESAQGLSLLFDALWQGTATDPSFPPVPGTWARFAPFPSFPLGASAPHPVDATISLSADTLNQALAELVASGFLSTDVDFRDMKSPIPLTVGTIAALLDPRLATLPGVSPEDPLGLRVTAKLPPDLFPAEGVVGDPVVPQGARWRYFKGTAAPPASWSSSGFSDASWSEGPSGFGYSTNPEEVRTVGTMLDDMASGAYTSLFVRKSFQIVNPAGLAGLVLRVLYDDAIVVYFNGQEIGRRNIGTAGTPPAFGALADAAGEPSVAFFDLKAVPGLLRAGTNVLAIQGHNAAATSSDFVLVPEVIARTPPPPGTLSSVPAQLELPGLELQFLADTAGDGTGLNDADGLPDEVPLFAYTLGLRLQLELSLALADSVPTLTFTAETADGSDPDNFPDAIVGGAGGLDIAVASEAVDVEDEILVEFAELLLAVFGPTLGASLGGLELPSLPLPELTFDLDGDGSPDVTLEIRAATFVPVDTTGDGRSDWICILSDLNAVSP